MRPSLQSTTCLFELGIVGSSQLNIVLGAPFTVKLSTFKNVTRPYQKQQQENLHVGPSESLLRRNRKWEDRGWSMRMSYRNREAASGEGEHMKDSLGV